MAGQRVLERLSFQLRSVDSKRQAWLFILFGYLVSIIVRKNCWIVIIIELSYPPSACR